MNVFNSETDKKETSKYPNSFKGFVIVIVTLILSALIGLAIGWSGILTTLIASPTPTPLKVATDDETLIVITTFANPLAEDKEAVQELIYNNLNQIIPNLNFNKLRVAIIPDIVLAKDGEAARTLGNTYQASLIIWGEVSGDDVIINTLNLKTIQGHSTNFSTSAQSLMAIPDNYLQLTIPYQILETPFMAWIVVGQLHLIQGTYQPALEAFSTALNLLPLEVTYNGLGDVYFKLAWLYQSMADVKQALHYYNKAVQYDADNALLYYNRAMLYVAEGDDLAALNDYNQTIALNPTYALAFNNRAIIYERQGNFIEALNDYNQAITLDSNFALAYNNRALLYASQGDITAAITDYDQAIMLDATNPNYYYSRGIAWAAVGNLEKAAADFDEAIVLKPDNADFYYNRAVVRSFLGRIEEAIADLEQVLQLSDDVELKKIAEEQLIMLQGASK